MSLIPQTAFRLLGNATRSASWGIGNCTTCDIRGVVNKLRDSAGG